MLWQTKDTLLMRQTQRNSPVVSGVVELMVVIAKIFNRFNWNSKYTKIVFKKIKETKPLDISRLWYNTKIVEL